MATSPAVWIITITQFGHVWSILTIMTQSPTYFKYIHGMSTNVTGILSGLPHFLKLAFSLTYSMFSDYLLRTNKLSRSNVRKLGTVLCCIMHGVLVMSIGAAKCSYSTAIVFQMLAIMVHGAISSGPLASIIDLTPNFSGVLLGITGIISTSSGFLSSALVGHLTQNNVNIFSGLVFLFV